MQPTEILDFFVKQASRAEGGLSSAKAMEIMSFLHSPHGNYSNLSLCKHWFGGD